MTQHELPLPHIIGHRGLAALAPENTLAGFRKAAQLGVKWVEFDIQLTKDKVLVVLHDETIDRTTDGHGPLSNKNYAELKHFNACAGFKGDFDPEPIPSLSDTIACLEKINIGANIEIKPAVGTEEATTLQLLEQLKTWPASLPPPLVSSFSLQCLAIVRAHSKDIYLGLLFDHWEANWEQTYRELDCYSLHLPWRALNLTRLTELGDKGARVLSYTVNNHFLAKTLWSNGVRAIFSDGLVF